LEHPKPLSRRLLQHNRREAVIRDTWMSAKCHSRRFYDVLVASAFPLIPMLVKTISSPEGLLKRLARENHAKGTAE
jgi:hypothetical protein